MARQQDYGPKTDHFTQMEDFFLPGSPDARPKNRDRYDDMPPIAGYSKKVKTKKNRSGVGEPTMGLQGGGGTNVSQAMSGKSGQYKSSYGGPAGNPTDNRPGDGQDYDYAKGQNRGKKKRRKKK